MLHVSTNSLILMEHLYSLLNVLTGFIYCIVHGLQSAEFLPAVSFLFLLSKTRQTSKKTNVFIYTLESPDSVFLNRSSSPPLAIHRHSSWTFLWRRTFLLSSEKLQHWEDERLTQGRGHISAFSTFVWLKGPFLLFRISCCVDNIHPDTSDSATQVLFVATNKKRLWLRRGLRLTTLPTMQWGARGNIKALGNQTGPFWGFVVLDACETDTVQDHDERRYSATK